MAVAGRPDFANANFDSMTADTATIGSLTVSSGTVTTSSGTFGSLTVTSTATINALTVSSNATLGSSTATATSNYTGVSQPNLSAFLSISTATVANVTGDSTAYTILFGEELYDRAGDFSSATGTFTARYTGLHRFDVGIELAGITSNHTAITQQLVTTARTYTPVFTMLSTLGTIGTSVANSWGVETLMSSGNTAFVRLTVAGASTGVDVVGGSTTAPPTWFSGRFIG